MEDDRGPLVDALPYIDTEYEETKDMRSIVAAMVAEEMKQMPPIDRKAFDERFPPPSTEFSTTKYTATELKRIAIGEPMEHIDTERYKLQPPISQSIPEWQNAVNNANSQLENQSLRILNLELCDRYGPASWRAAIESMQRDLERLQERHEELSAEIEDVNRERRAEQESVADELRQMAMEWHTIVQKNVEIQVANAQLEREIARLKQSKGGDGESESKSPKSEKPESHRASKRVRRG